MQLTPGQGIGKYVLRRQLGRGAFCESWLGEHSQLEGHQAALKIALDPSYRELLRSEGRILAQLRHPAIVRILDIELATEPAHVVQEYVAGHSLRWWIEQRRLDTTQALALFRQLLEALDHAHGHGVVHRDIKPENLIADEQGRLYVLDFGLGAVEEAATRELLLSHSLQTTLGVPIAGTLQYMSPEQRAGQPVDGRSDLYAAGIVLFEMLAGRPPALHDSTGVSPAVDRIYHGLVAPLEQRFASAGVVLGELGQLLEQSDVYSEAPPARMQREEEDEDEDEDEELWETCRVSKDRRGNPVLSLSGLFQTLFLAGFTCGTLLLVFTPKYDPHTLGVIFFTCVGVTALGLGGYLTHYFHDS